MTNGRSGKSSMRRAVSLALLLAPAATWGAGEAEQVVEAWVHLTLPALATVPVDERDTARERLRQQQDAVMAELRALGAVEQARVQVVRNALAVRLPRSAVDAARRIAGVRTVTPVRHRDLHRP